MPSSEQSLVGTVTEGGTDPLSVDPGSARKVMADLVAESYPEDMAIYRTANNETFTGAEMRREILGGTEIGRAYATSILRVSRDLLARQAQRVAERDRAAASAAP